MCLSLIFHRVERASGCHDRATVGPLDHVSGYDFTFARRVREGHHDRAFDIPGHRPDHFFGEQPWCTRGSGDDRGLVCLDDVDQVDRLLTGQAPGLGEFRGPRHLVLVRFKTIGGHADQTDRVVHSHVVGEILFRHPGSNERVPEMTRDSYPGGPRSDHQEPLVGQLGPRSVAGGDDAGDDGGARSLDVVVERWQHRSIPIKEGERVRLQEVLPLQNRIGETSLDCVNELIYQLVVRLTTKARLLPTGVKVVFEEIRVVGPHVEADRQRVRRMDPGAEGVESELADRDHHSADTLVTETEYPLVVGDDDQPNVLVANMPEDVVDLSPMIRCDPQPAAPTESVAEAGRCFTDRRRVHDRRQLFDVLGKDLEVQRLVATLE